MLRIVTLAAATFALASCGEPSPQPSSSARGLPSRATENIEALDARTEALNRRLDAESPADSTAP